MTIAAASFFTALTPSSPIGAATPDAVPGQMGFGAVVDAAIAGLAAPAATGAPASAAIPPTAEGTPPSDASGAKFDSTLSPPALPVAPPAVTIESPPVPPIAGPAPAITPAVAIATQPADGSAFSGKAAPTPTATKVVTSPQRSHGGVARVAELEAEAPEADDEAVSSATPAPDAQTAAPAPIVPAPASPVPVVIPSPVEPMIVAPPMPPTAPATPPAVSGEGKGERAGGDWGGGSADPAPSARHAASRAPDREVGENRAAATGFADRLAAAAEPRVQQPTPAHAPGGPDLAAAQAPTQQPATQAPAQQPAEVAGARQPVVNARPGRMGYEMGVEIARRVSIGGDELTVRLNPVEMGRIEVRLSFDERGSLRAVVAAESPAALDLLRRDSADLGRALADAGVRADAGSFRFDARSGGEGSQFWQRQQDGGQRSATGRGYATAGGDGGDEEPTYRPLRTSGRVDLMA